MRLTDRQARLFRVLAEWLTHHHRTPTLRELVAEMKSKARTVTSDLKVLEREQLLQFEGGERVHRLKLRGVTVTVSPSRTPLGVLAARVLGNGAINGEESR